MELNSNSEAGLCVAATPRRRNVLATPSSPVGNVSCPVTGKNATGRRCHPPVTRRHRYAQPATSEFGLNQIVSVRLNRFLTVAGLALLLATAGCFSSRSSSGDPGTTIPAIANFAGVKIGFSSQEDLARRWGEGKVTVGGHPNSRRVWRIKGTDWVLDTDGFDYSHRGLVVDGLLLSVPSAAPDFYLQDAVDAPTARLPKEKFAWMGGVRLGMSRSAVEQFLKGKSLAATATNLELVVQAPGHNALTDHPGAYETWVVRLTFETNVLTKLNIYADERTTQ